MHAFLITALAAPAGLPAIFDPASLLHGLLIGVVAAAAVAGDQVGYMLARRFGRRWFKDDARIFKTADLARAEEFFARRGGPSIVLARFVPVVRTFAPLAAGIARYNYRAFRAWNIAGAVGWAASVT